MSDEYKWQQLDKWSGRVENTLDSLDKRLDRLDVTMARNTEVLELHVRRTNELEDLVLPLEKRRQNVDGFVRISLGAIGAIAGVGGVILVLVRIGVI